MKAAYLARSTSDKPFDNLALEDCLMDSLPEDGAVLFLWQNRHSVVIGRNQDAFAECPLAQFEKDGGTLARRLTGGGAVYHDGGNLNYSIISPTKDHDVSAQMRTVAVALGALGLEAEVSGRNDISIGGKKVSGNAFLSRRGVSLHHGTLLVDSDLSRIARYLSPGRAKLAAHAVPSIASRVTTLAACARKGQNHTGGTDQRTISIATVSEALAESFARLWSRGLEHSSAPGSRSRPVRPLEVLDTSGLTASPAFMERRAFFADPVWRYGLRETWTVRLQERFPVGCVELCLLLECPSNERPGTRVTRAAFYSDLLEVTALDDLARAIEGSSLVGGRLDLRALGEDREGSARRIADWLAGLDLSGYCA